MYQKIKDVDNFQPKARRLATVLLHMRDVKGDHYFNAEDVFNSSELDRSEMDSILYFLYRGGIIDSINNLSEIKLSKYGEFLHRGFIRNAYAPYA